MPDQSSLNLSAQSAGPVDCLGRTFPSDNARREHYLKLLATKLKDAEFRKIEGFPIGTDEAILALSDPPYYTACPNPWLDDFIDFFGKSYDSRKAYHREPFAADVSEGKYDPVYMLHPYPTKVPHKAIAKFIAHYTDPGDIILDCFCGTGSAGAATQDSGGNRKCVLADLSPLATYIANLSNNQLPKQEIDHEAEAILDAVEKECSWMFETRHSDGRQIGRVNYTAWSDVFTCPECAKEIVFWEVAVDEAAGIVKSEFKCPHCKRSNLTKQSVESVWETRFDQELGHTIKQAKQIPVLINYSVGNKRFQKIADAFDHDLQRKIEQFAIPYPFPKNELPEGDNTTQPKVSHGLTHVHHFYTRRNLYAMAAVYARIKRPELKFLITKVALQITKLYRFTNQSGVWGAGGGPMTGTLYVPSLVKELDVIKQMRSALKDLIALPERKDRSVIVSTGSAINLAGVPSKCIDYVFIDPPFGANKMYSELNLLWESWLGVRASNTTEAIQNKSQRKGVDEYRQLMASCLREVYRVLKPGRWITVEFSNTQATVWNAIQTAIQEAGFIVSHVAALDKQKKSFKAVVSATAVKQDLIISAYKPNGGLEERFKKQGAAPAGVWDFIQTHLNNLIVVQASGGVLEPIVERDPRVLYDRMVAFYVSHSTQVPLSSAEFQAGLGGHFVERDGMWFLPEQVGEYDKKRVQMETIGQLAIFVEDERSAINWLRSFLKERPSAYNDIQPDFMQQLNASWKKWEARPELRALLDQNFLCYNGTGEVPSQIHSYLSTQFKELRNLAKDHAQLRQKGKDRWYVPDPKKNVDVETVRNKRLLEEFWSYLPDGYLSAARSPDRNPTLPMPGLASPRPKVPRSKKLRQVRTEAVRVGFKYCYQQKDYPTILAVADMLPESVLNEDEQLQMLYDNAALRAGATIS